MQVECYELEIYLTYPNKETADCLLNNVIKLIYVQLKLFIEVLQACSLI